MNESLRTPSSAERADVHLRHLVERLVREGRSEAEIHTAVRRATRRPTPRRPRRSRLASLVRSRG